MVVDVDPNRVTTKTPVDLEVTLSAPGQTVTGWVWVHVDGDNYLRQLRNGRVTFDLGRFKKAGDVRRLRHLRRQRDRRAGDTADHDPRQPT